MPSSHAWRTLAALRTFALAPFATSFVFLGWLSTAAPAQQPAQAAHAALAEPWQSRGEGNWRWSSREGRVHASIDALGLHFEGPESSSPSAGGLAQVHVRTTGFGRAGQVEAVPPCAPNVLAERVQLLHPGFTEWFEARAVEVEQGWTISAPPAAADGAPLWIGLEFEGLKPQIFEDGLGARLVDERARTRLYYHGLRACDAGGRSIPLRLRTSEHGVGIELDDRGAVYPITVDPVVTGVAWSWSHDVANMEMGAGTAAGDVNGDGYGDILVASQGFQDGSTQLAGRVWAFYGSASGLPATPSKVIQPPVPQLAGYFGQISCLGDVTGDGYDDIAIGSWGFDGNFTDEGAVYIYRGGPTGLENQPYWQIFGPGPNRNLGEMVAYAGDVNGDGLDDILVYSSAASGGAHASISLWFGSSTRPAGALGAPDWELTEADLGIPLADFSHGWLSGVGDVDADGYDDFAFASYTLNTGSGLGMAFLWKGGPSGPAAPNLPPAWSAGIPGSTNFGLALLRAGDLNADGFADVVIADSAANANLAGAAYVFLGQGTAAGLPSVPNQTLNGQTAGERLGSRGGPAGDLDGDGFADLALSALSYGASNDGIVYLYRGGPSGVLSTTPSETITYPFLTSGGRFGMTAVTAGDVNGDGRSDLLVNSNEGSCPPNAVNGEGYAVLYYGQPTGDPLVTPSAPGHPTTLAGSTTSRFGSALCASGDVNGDGFSDLLVGSPEFDTTNGDAGKVELHLGSKDGTAPSSVWSVTGAAPGRRLGSAVSFAGDVDNDGFCDVLVGEPNFSGTFANQGRMLLFRGNASGALAATPDFTFSPAEAGALLGTSLAGAGDLNGDGFADVIVGAPGTHAGQLDRGAVYVFYGQRTAPYLNPAPTLLDAGLAGIRYGAAVAPAGDVNGDGFSDVLIGAPKGGALSEEGVVFVHLGSLGGVVTSANWSYSPLSAGAHLGSAVYAAGDVDGDGLSDILVGAQDLNAGSNGGVAFVFRGRTGAAPNIVEPPIATLLGAQAGSHYGAALAPVGDLNGDGFCDIAVGAPDYNAGQASQGRYEVFLGNSSGVSLTPAFAESGSTAGGNLGASLAPSGDLDGDGFSDLVCGGPGLGSGSGALTLREGGTAQGNVYANQQRRAGDTFAIQHLCLADSTTNMLLKVVAKTFLNVPSTAAGRERIRLEWELKRMPLPLDGTSFQHGTGLAFPNDQWVDCGVSSTLAVPVPSLQPQFGYHWRLRVQNRNPLFPHSRWVTIQGSGRQEKKFGTGSDCNGNTIPDDLDIANLTSADCDPIGPLGPNGVPDECELAGDDLNADNVPDKCEAQIPFCTPNSGGVIACPCNNNPTGASRGCENSLGTGGASITGSGNALLANDTLVLTVSGIGSAGGSCAGSNGNLTCILLQGGALSSGTPFGDGVRCVGGALKRLNVGLSSAGVYAFGPGVSAQSAALGDVINPAINAVRGYLVYYRDACAAFCPGSTFNASNGWRVIWQP